MYGFKATKTARTPITQYQPILVPLENVDFNTSSFIQVDPTKTQFSCTRAGIYNISFNIQMEQNFLNNKSTVEADLRINSQTANACIQTYNLNDTITLVGSTTEKLNVGDVLTLRFIPPRNVTSWNIDLYPGSFLAIGGGPEA